MPDNDYGERLRNIRTMARLTLRDVGGELGVSAGYVSNCEHGREPLDRTDFLDMFHAIMSVYYKAHKLIEQLGDQVDDAINQRTASARDSAAG